MGRFADDGRSFDCHVGIAVAKAASRISPKGFSAETARGRSRKGLAKMTHIRRLEPLVDRVHGVAGMADVCLRFVDRVVISCKAGDDGDSGAVKTEMGESYTPEGLKPSFRRIL